ncbi:putative RNA-binding protein associated with RNAse of E/G family [Paenibacillus shirakamiensis]|uniref:RNA-binding protein associated with RNAse of E/G family n=1 Tax=Paenibacillus shirakamiensis TaxID=1265935 RepID=A0ABS4JFF4_9BACL|nr:DUF402 domain-containing protein [Paenibacillus shirakamiensis]MBP1999691.1 putative RNA-binding protein associated with RNAse of E/G family [Paenibacillus shirakamiensis]
MKRKFGDRANWRRVTRRNFTSKYVESEAFTGYITLYSIYALREPLWKTYGGHTFRIADKGYSWLQYYPKNSHYIVTAMFDDKKEIIEWYIDVCKNQGITDQGVPWFDDLYLDIVVLRNGEVFLLDQDELDDALHQRLITARDYEMASATTRDVLHAIDAHTFPFFMMSLEHRKNGFLEVTDEPSDS